MDVPLVAIRPSSLSCGCDARRAAAATGGRQEDAREEAVIGALSLRRPSSRSWFVPQGRQSVEMSPREFWNLAG